MISLIFFSSRYSSWSSLRKRRISVPRPRVGVDSVGGDSEGSTSSGLPNVLLVVVVLRDDLDTLGDEVGTSRNRHQLTNHESVGTR